MSSSFRSGRAAVTAALTLFAVVLALIPGVANAVDRESETTASRAIAVPAAVDMSTFNPGNIISDAVFFDKTTMSESDVQAFLDSRGGTCRPGHTCLRDYRMSTVSKSADSYCSGYSGAANESAARIIAKVAASCGINPQVLLVTLQKEQALVLATAPSSGHYKFAMGQGCPDTAACDSRYYGFQNQVYGAARQFQIYAEGRYFTWYAPGRTWNILYHPDGSRGCGSSAVYIANKATAGLYYYTPYQPNRAALAAGSGEGDRCSSYGNRNFFRFFSDWFGSTQSPTSALVRGAGRAEVYLVSAGQKHHVQSGADLAILESALGGFVTVSTGYIDILPTGKPASRYAHDPRTGTLYLLQPNGTRHWLRSEALISRYGFVFSSYVDLDARQVDAFRTGEPVADYFRSDGGPEYYRWENGKKRHIVNDVAWSQESSRAGGFVAAIPAAAAARIPKGMALVAAGTLVREDGSDAVYLTGTGTSLSHVPSFALAGDAGASVYRIVPKGTLAGFTRASSPLAPVLRCLGNVYVIDGGAIARVTGAAPAAPAATVPDTVCRALPVSSRTVAAPFFVKDPGADPIYLVDKNTLRHVQSVERLRELVGSKPLSQLSWSAGTLSMMKRGVPVLADGTFVAFGGEKIYVVQGAALRHVPDVRTLIRLAGGSPTVVQLPRGAESSYEMGTPLPAAE